MMKAFILLIFILGATLASPKQTAKELVNYMATMVLYFWCDKFENDKFESDNFTLQ